MIRSLLLAAFGASLSIGVAQAQDIAGYPSRPIRLVVPFAAGGGADSPSPIFGPGIGGQVGGTGDFENNRGARGAAGFVPAPKEAHPAASPLHRHTRVRRQNP